MYDDVILVRRRRRRRIYGYGAVGGLSALGFALVFIFIIFFVFSNPFSDGGFNPIGFWPLFVIFFILIGCCSTIAVILRRVVFYSYLANVAANRRAATQRTVVYTATPIVQPQPQQQQPYNSSQGYVQQPNYNQQQQPQQQNYQNQQNSGLLQNDHLQPEFKQPQQSQQQIY